MDVKTKFKIGDKIWIVKNYKAQEIEVLAVVVTEKGVGYAISDIDFARDAVPESCCYASKEELIKSL